MGKPEKGESDQGPTRPAERDAAGEASALEAGSSAGSGPAEPPFTSPAWSGMSYFSADVSLEWNCTTLVLSLAEQSSLVSSFSYWHGPGDPSTWLCAAVLAAVQRKYPLVPHSIAVDLAALALGVPRPLLIDRIRWHENYVRWHDGVEYSVLDDDVVP